MADVPPYDYGDLVHVRRGDCLYRACLVDVGLDSLVIRYPSGYTTTVPMHCASVVRQRTLADVIAERAREERRHKLDDWDPPLLPPVEAGQSLPMLPAPPEESGGEFVGADVWRRLG